MNVHSPVDYYAAHTNVDAYLRTVSSLIPGSRSLCSGGQGKEKHPTGKFLIRLWCVAAVLNILSPGSVGPIPSVAFRPLSNLTAHQSPVWGRSDAGRSSGTVSSGVTHGPSVLSGFQEGCPAQRYLLLASVVFLSSHCLKVSPPEWC